MTYFRLWALYFDHPTHPGKWQVRTVDFRNGQVPKWSDEAAGLADSAAEARAAIPPGLPEQTINPEAEPAIRGAWLETVQEPAK